MAFPNQTPKPDVRQMQQDVLSFWKEHQTFDKSISLRDEKKPYRFYDGPPFITGLPHYGSLLSSICKDVMPRYQTMKGKRVERVRWRDCHGLPIEEKVQKKLWLQSSKEIEQHGIEEFIKECYNYTRETSNERWRYVDNVGRWVDFDNSYKTMDNNYMESTMRVFEQLWKKWMIYKGKRVSLYSTKLSTPISNFEVAMDDTYEEVNDPAITVMFDLSENGGDRENTFALAWTTTPWTIPCNMALAINRECSYVKVAHNGKRFVVAENRVEDIFKGKEIGETHSIESKEIEWLSYTPPFDFFKNKTNNNADHKIYHAEFITDTDGTGIGHEAPEFGDVDFELAQDKWITISEAMDNEGKYTSQIGRFAWIFYRDNNDTVMNELKDMDRLFHKGSITHRVAFCPRSGTPLVHKAQDSRFINIRDMKDKLLEKNEEINWFPAHFKHGRFAKSIETAPDRCVSRTRYWGTPMPVWAKPWELVNTDECLVIWSRDEIFAHNQKHKQLVKILFWGTEWESIDAATFTKDYQQILTSNAGQTVSVTWSDNDIQALYTHINWLSSTDESNATEYLVVESGARLNLHRPYIDSILLTHPETGETLERIPEVLDVRLDSASMPYAQVHYPFENKEKFEASFPADYIVEYVGQIRARFYVMHVIGVALFDKPAYTNVICTGVMKGNDGRKMSKSFGNYPDPKDSFMKYGGDAIRMHSINSPVVAWGDVDVKEEAFLETLKSSILPLWNSFYFFTTYANIDGWTASWKDANMRPYNMKSENFLDHRIISELQHVISEIDEHMQAYDMQRAVRPLVWFFDNLTNRYIRRSRRRFWKSENDGDKLHAYETLYQVLDTVVKLAAPFMPFVSEYIFRALKEWSADTQPHRAESSVHLEHFPQADQKLMNESLSQSMKTVQTIVSTWLSRRTEKKIRVRQPLSSITIGVQIDDAFKDIIADELNIKHVIVDESINSKVTKICKPDGKILGRKLGKDFKNVLQLAKSGQFEEIEHGQVRVGEFVLHPDEYEISYIKSDESDNIAVEDGMVIIIDDEITKELEIEGYARDLVRMIQEARKDADYHIADRISLSITDTSWRLTDLQEFYSYIEDETLSTIVDELIEPDKELTVELGEYEMVFGIKK